MEYFVQAKGYEGQSVMVHEDDLDDLIASTAAEYDVPDSEITVIESLTLSLDVDLHSHGEDETFGAYDIAAARYGIDTLVADYAKLHRDRIAEIHGLSEPELDGKNLAEYVDVSTTVVGC